MNMFQEISANKQSILVRKPIYGIGINDANYIISPTNSFGKQQECPYYKTWKAMLQRCYDTKFKQRHPHYKECSVTEEWHTFSNFKAWMIQQDWVGKQLDKDLLFPGNKIYSPKTCIFLSLKINNMITHVDNNNGLYKKGVRYNKKNKKYQARCSDGIKCRHLGYFTSEDEAHKAYCMFKKEIILFEAQKQQCLFIKQALIFRANTLI